MRYGCFNSQIMADKAGAFDFHVNRTANSSRQWRVFDRDRTEVVCHQLETKAERCRIENEEDRTTN